MPRLHKRRNSNTHYVLTCIRGAVVTFQLTPEGERKLAAAGVHADDKFRRAILLDLYRTGDAFTHGSGVDDPGLVAAGQIEMDFTNDPEPEALFPACASCAGIEDLHLTLYQLPGGFCAQLECPQCRGKDKGPVDTSIPLWLLSLSHLNHLFALKPNVSVHNSVTRLRELLQAQFDNKWEALRKARRSSQQSLLDGTSSNELNLGG